MPNWCYTSMNIRRAEDGGVLPLFKAIEEATKTDSSVKNDFGKMWLGNLVEKLLKTDPLSHTYECRGDMTNFELYSEDELFVGTETAWGPMFGMWIDMIEKYIPGATLTYTAEEPGCGLYLTNDPDYENKYCVDSWGNEVSSEWVASENYVREVGRKLTGKKCDRRTKIDKVVELINDSYDEYEVAVHKWDYEAGVA